MIEERVESKKKREVAQFCDSHWLYELKRAPAAATDHRAYARRRGAHTAVFGVSEQPNGINLTVLHSSIGPVEGADKAWTRLICRDLSGRLT